MRLPAYLLLPLVGAVVLVAVVLGSWLWPEPVVPTPNLPPAFTVPVAVAPPPEPPPAFRASPPSPGVRAPPVRPAPPPVEPLAPAPSRIDSVPPPPPPPPEPVPGPPVPPMPQGLSPERQAEVARMWGSVRERTAEKAAEVLRDLERQRDEAQARGDQAEVERLDQSITRHREGLEVLRGTRPYTGPLKNRYAPAEPAEPPTQ